VTTHRGAPRIDTRQQFGAKDRLVRGRERLEDAMTPTAAADSSP
jgi:hypothetical protein